MQCWAIYAASVVLALSKGIMIWHLGVHKPDTWHAYFRPILANQEVAHQSEPRGGSSGPSCSRGRGRATVPSTPTSTPAGSSKPSVAASRHWLERSNTVGKVRRLNFLWQFTLKQPMFFPTQGENKSSLHSYIYFSTKVGESAHNQPKRQSRRFVLGYKKKCKWEMFALLISAFFSSLSSLWDALFNPVPFY